jgi:hypothetical protein
VARLISYAKEDLSVDAYSDLNHALVDVRKAYRLIWLYQRRVIDIVRLITDALGYEFYAWDTTDIGRMSGSRTTDPFGGDRWIWSTLPLYRMSLLYLPPNLPANIQRSGEWMLEIFIESDTGAKAREDESEPPPTEFAPVEKSETVLKLYAWHCSADGSRDWFSEIWKQLEWPDEDCKVTDEDPAIPVRVLRRSFELSKLPDRASVDRAIEEFKALVSEKFGASAKSAVNPSDSSLTSFRVRG